MDKSTYLDYYFNKREGKGWGDKSTYLDYYFIKRGGDKNTYLDS